MPSSNNNNLPLTFSQLGQRKNEAMTFNKNLQFSQLKRPSKTPYDFYHQKDNTKSLFKEKKMQSRSATVKDSAHYFQLNSPFRSKQNKLNEKEQKLYELRKQFKGRYQQIQDEICNQQNHYQRIMQKIYSSLQTFFETDLQYYSDILIQNEIAYENCMKLLHPSSELNFSSIMNKIKQVNFQTDAEQLQLKKISNLVRKIPIFLNSEKVTMLKSFQTTDISNQSQNRSNNMQKSMKSMISRGSYSSTSKGNQLNKIKNKEIPSTWNKQNHQQSGLATKKSTPTQDKSSLLLQSFGKRDFKVAFQQDELAQNYFQDNHTNSISSTISNSLTPLPLTCRNSTKRHVAQTPLRQPCENQLESTPQSLKDRQIQGQLSQCKKKSAVQMFDKIAICNSLDGTIEENF